MSDQNVPEEVPADPTPVDPAPVVETPEEVPTKSKEDLLQDIKDAFNQCYQIDKEILLALLEKLVTG